MASQAVLDGFWAAWKRIGIPDYFVEHGSQAQLRKDLWLDADGIANAAKSLLSRKERTAPPFIRVM
jgi:1-deoxy-D-xylulose-5-phosphate synthase